MSSSSSAPRIGFAVGAYVFQELQPEDIPLIAEAGFRAFEPYRGLTMRWVERPRELKDLLDRNGVTMVTCSNGGPGQSCEFIDPAARAQTIADHVAFARDFLTVFGCAHFKINMGSRPAGGTSESDLEAIALTLNEIGRQTLDLGVKLAPHPHIWGPIERPHEIRRIMELTDPRYVYMTPDTAHINLGGGDPVEILSDYYDRIAAIHWKDTKAAYRGFTGPTPTVEAHRQENLYRDLGAGGVDLPTIWGMLNERGYAGWITLDLDPPRASEGEGTVMDKLLMNKRYLIETLGVEAL